jgi:trehalose-6-phosphate synthase
MLDRNSGALLVNKEVLPLPSLIATMAGADFLLVPSIAEGMGLVAKEFAALHGCGSAGVVILTPNVGSRVSLPGAIVARSNSVEHLTNCLVSAMELPLEERSRLAAMNSRAVTAESFDDWIADLISLL